MTLNTDSIYYGPNHEHIAFAAWPAPVKENLPTVIVVQEIWGVDAHIENVTRRFAEAGYFAVAPDIFCQHGKRPEPLTNARLAAVKDVMSRAPNALRDAQARDAALTEIPAAQRAELNESFEALLQTAMGQTQRHVAALHALAQHVRVQGPTRDAKVGCVGFCLGGGLAMQLACVDAELAAAVSFYGRAPEAALLPSVTCPILAFYGERDTALNAGIDNLEQHMRKFHKRFEKHIYQGAEHAFFNDTRASYNADASRDAFARTLTLLGHDLVPRTRRSMG